MLCCQGSFREDLRCYCDCRCDVLRRCWVPGRRKSGEIAVREFFAFGVTVPVLLGSATYEVVASIRHMYLPGRGAAVVCAEGADVADNGCKVSRISNI